LHEAIDGTSEMEIVRVLLNHDANVDIVDCHGQYPIHKV